MKWMLLTLLVLPFSLLAAEDVRVRMQLLSHQGEVIRTSAYEPVVGERITLAVDVMTTTWFARAPRFPHLVIRDMIALKTGAFATNFSERIGGVSYAVQRREYSLFPQRAGSYTLHGIEVDVQVASAGGGTNGPQQLRTQPLQLSVKSLPPRDTVESLDVRKGYFSELLQSESSLPDVSSSWVAKDVDLSQTFSSSLEDLKVGDMVERRVSIRASGTLGMLIPPMRWPRSDNFSQRSLTSEIADSTDRGEFVGTRTEIHQYTLLSEGQMTLPALSVSWWDGGEWLVNTLAAQTVSVNAAPNRPVHMSAIPQSLGDWLQQLPWDVFLLIALFVALVAGLLLRFGGNMFAACNHYLVRWKNSEVVCWWRLRGVCCGSDAASIVRRYYEWRAKSVAFLRPQPDQWASLWSEVFLLAAEQVRPTFKQRRQLWGLFVSMRRADTRHGATALTQKFRKGSAVVSLQPLNPE